MKFKEKMNQAAGFTLVELIVVIAILAILAGVAVPAYSGYITQANKSNDETLASEIKQALLLAHYSGALEADTSVIIRYNGTAEVKGADADAVAAGEAAMAAAFGENWKNTLKLSWDGWTNTASSVDITQLNGSSFAESNIPQLTEHVSLLTGVLSGYLGNDAIRFDKLEDYIANNEHIDMSTVSSDKIGQVKANLAVLFAADSINTYTSANAEDSNKNFEYVYKTNQSYDVATKLIANGMDTLSANAVAYAKMEGMLNYLDAEVAKPAPEAEYESYRAAAEISLTAITSEWAAKSATLSGASDVENIIKNTYAAITSDDYLLLLSMQYNNSDAIANDAQAFLSYMTGVEEAAPSLTEDLTQMESSDFYKSGTVSSAVNNYLAACEALSGYTGSAVVVIFDGEKVSAYPLDATK